MASKPDYYKTLGVSKNATADEIKKAFRMLARTNHPDAGGDEGRSDKSAREALTIEADVADFGASIGEVLSDYIRIEDDERYGDASDEHREKMLNREDDPLPYFLRALIHIQNEFLF
jgi:DnaJ-class molecular chaperone